MLPGTHSLIESYTPGVIIVQLFDWPFTKVQKALPRLQKLGVTHVLVSPPQKSHDSTRWWGRYQPVDFTRIEGPLGNAEALHSLCLAAGQRGMAVVADTVIHHLSNESRYVKMRGDRILSAQYPHFCRNDLSGVHRLGKGRGLPILDTRSPWVRSQLRQYLHDLFELGVRGYRFDSAKHIDPHLFPHLLEGLPPVLSFGELVYSEPEHFPTDYWHSMRGYDFPLAAHLKRAFAPGGDLGSLLHPRCLWGPVSVPFVNHHDLIKNRKGFSTFRISDPTDRRLAYAYILGRGEGVPLVYGTDLRYREVKAGLAFHRFCSRQPAVPVAAGRNFLALRRGSVALLAINKAGTPTEITTELQPGIYRDLVTGWSGATSHGRIHWSVPGRSVALLVKVE